MMPSLRYLWMKTLNFMKSIIFCYTLIISLEAYAPIAYFEKVCSTFRMNDFLNEDVRLGFFRYFLKNMHSFGIGIFL
jgi:hypothetical protein